MLHTAIRPPALPSHSLMNRRTHLEHGTTIFNASFTSREFLASWINSIATNPGKG